MDNMDDDDTLNDFHVSLMACKKLRAYFFTIFFKASYAERIEYLSFLNFENETTKTQREKKFLKAYTSALDTILTISEDDQTHNNIQQKPSEEYLFLTVLRLKWIFDLNSIMISTLKDEKKLKNGENFFLRHIDEMPFFLYMLTMEGIWNVYCCEHYLESFRMMDNFANFLKDKEAFMAEAAKAKKNLEKIDFQSHYKCFELLDCDWIMSLVQIDKIQIHEDEHFINWYNDLVLFQHDKESDVLRFLKIVRREKENLKFTKFFNQVGYNAAKAVFLL